MKKSDVFPSKYLKADDLKGKPVTATIERAAYETLKTPDGKENSKTVLYFVGAKKTLPLNLTNWDAAAEICGEDTDDWNGCKIELYADKTTMGGRTVACVRVRAPVQRELAKAPALVEEPPPVDAIPPMADEVDDAIPF